MKELYIAPEVQILCFEALEGLAYLEDYTGLLGAARTTSGPASTTGSVPGDWSEDVDPGEDL